MARSLPSYLDRNFHIHAGDGDYVLKVAHPSWARKDLDLENHAMMALAAHEPDIQWPRVQRTAAGEHLLCLSVAGCQCHVRMLSFVPGSTYAEVMANGLPQAACRRLQEDLG
ncbi:MAG TPA: phosphotransferase, partial [Oleiagrimonas sp.]|nr:phosphotransferase [Oleiagrimonas sp.]